MSVLVATDGAAVAGVEEATTVLRTAKAGRMAVDVAAGAEDLSRSRAVSLWSVSLPIAAACTKNANSPANALKLRPADSREQPASGVSASLIFEAIFASGLSPQDISQALAVIQGQIGAPRKAAGKPDEPGRDISNTPKTNEQISERILPPLRLQRESSEPCAP
eukprot:6205447-Pleurochrysis_carterae.AAC.4